MSYKKLMETLPETGSLKNASLFTQLDAQLDRLGGTRPRCIQSVAAQHLAVRKVGVQDIVREDNA